MIYHIRFLRDFFTLIELLIVIAIIAILASLLLPAFQKAREKSKAITCINNYKTVSTACMMYQEDNDGFFMTYWSSPPHPVSRKPTGCFPNPQHCIYNYISIETYKKGKWAEKLPLGIILVSGQRSKYACPSKHAVPGKCNATIGINTILGDSSGLSNSAQKKYYFGLRSGKYSPSHFAYLGDCESQSNYNGGAGGWFGYSYVSLNHGDSGTVGFADGHVDLIRKNLYFQSREYVILQGESTFRNKFKNIREAQLFWMFNLK